LLIESDGGIEDDDGKDRDGVDDVAKDAGDNTGGDQNPNDQALELAKKHSTQTDAFALLQLVSAIECEAFRRFVRRQSGRRGAELCEHVLRRLAVPSVTRCRNGGNGGHVERPISPTKR
jgi:hypothetical protein